MFDVEETAARQVEALGFRRDDVRHIITTHFDVDHIGGIADFPDAQVHVTAAEAFGAMQTPDPLGEARFRAGQWAHGPKIVEHDPDGEQWRGFAAAKELDTIAPGIVLVSLPGHTRGHACVAVDAGHRWVLHCGDAFYYRGTLDGQSPVPLGIKLSERSSPSIRSGCATTTPGSRSSTHAASPTCSSSRPTIRPCWPRRSLPACRPDPCGGAGAQRLGEIRLLEPNRLRDRAGLLERLDAVPVQAELHQHHLGVLGGLRRARGLERFVVELDRAADHLERRSAVGGLDLDDHVVGDRLLVGARGR